MAIERTVKDDILYLTEDGNPVLTVSETLQDAQVLIRLSGSLRSDTDHELQDELIALTTLGLHLVLDLSEVTYISAACQQVFLNVQQKMDDLDKGSLRLTKLTPVLLEEFEKTGLSELLLIES